MKTGLAQLEVIPGQPFANTQKMLQFIEAAKIDGVDLLVFPEMVIPGYLLGDEWERSAFLQECENCGEQIKQASTNITVIFGNVAIDWSSKNEDGRPRKYNALFVAESGAFVAHPTTTQTFFIKMLMPNYREFDDNRHFFDPRKLAYENGWSWQDMIEPAHTRLGKLGCVLCEDGWDEDYNISPLTILADKGAQLLVNISSSPYTLNKNSKRNRVFAAQASKYRLSLVYVNATGLQDNGKTLFTFDGASCAYNAQGDILVQAPAFTETRVDLTINSTNPISINTPTADTIGEQFLAIEYGTRKFMERAGVRKVVIGISGGIDSALAAAIYRRILPPENLSLVSMPGPFTSQTTRKLSQQLARNLDCPFAEIPIADSLDLTREQIQTAVFRNSKESTQLNVSDFVLENIQARDRSSRILASVAAAFGGAFTCNANKSEMTVGYSTLYGDLGGFLANIADLWKSEVYAMAEFLNREVYGSEVIPQGIFKIVPSAELSSQQNVDLNQGDPLIYPYHDCLFRSWVERWQRATPEDNLRWYLSGDLAEQLGYAGDIQALFPNAATFIADLERWWNLYQGMAIAKRIQAPPILAVKRRAFGFDHREAQLGPRYTQAYLTLKKQALPSS
jgi:NAD+ synthase (glutamine-hydrolysing)